MRVYFKQFACVKLRCNYLLTYFVVIRGEICEVAQKVATEIACTRTPETMANRTQATNEVFIAFSTPKVTKVPRDYGLFPTIAPVPHVHDLF